MKKNKIILLILVTFLFSGCSIKYNLSINEDLTVNEAVEASERVTRLETTTGQDAEISTNSLYKLYKIGDTEYNVSTISDGTTITTTASTKFNSLEEYEDYFKSDIVKEVNITKKDSYITLEYKQDVPLTEYASKSLIYDSIEVNINIPFKVKEHNADSVSGNTYTWNIKKDGSIKDIKITFDKDKTDISRKINFLGFFEINVKYSVLLTVGAIVILLAIVGYVYIKNRKNNRF